jgi:hypothetical protein
MPISEIMVAPGEGTPPARREPKRWRTRKYVLPLTDGFNLSHDLMTKSETSPRAAAIGIYSLLSL